MAETDQLVYFRPGTKAGDILAYNRAKRGYTPRQVAAADGKWSLQEVLEVESSRAPGPDVVRRYLDALDRLGQGQVPARAGSEADC